MTYEQAVQSHVKELEAEYQKMRARAKSGWARAVACQREVTP